MSWLASLIISGLMMSNIGSNPTVALIEKSAADQTQQTTVGEETERFDQTYPFNSNGSVALSNLNGSVTIDTWDRNEVRVEYTKVGSDKEVMGMVDVRVDSTKDRIEVEANYDRWKGGNSHDWEKWKGRKVTVTFKLTVPRTAVLNEIETVNGSIVLSNLTNSCKVSTVNGHVNAKNLRGNSSLSTVNGVVEADYDQLDATTRIDLNTVNGKALLTIPSDSNATVKADTVNGSIFNDFGLPIRKGRYVGRDLYGKLGNGEARIKLSSVNGGLSVSRKQDGRSPSPAVNLLPAREEDDKDDMDMDIDVDMDMDVDISDAVITKDVERAIRDAVRVVPRVAVDATTNIALSEEALREMAKAQKDIIRAQKDSMVAVNNARVNTQVRDAMRDQQRRLRELSRVTEASQMAALPAMEKKGETLTVKGTPRIIVEAKNCAVTVRGWDRSEVEYSLTKFSRVAGQSAAGVTVDKDESRVKIRVNNGNPLNRYRLEVFVPHKSNLKISTDHEIRLEGVSGELDLSTVSEDINVRDSDGKLTATTSEGKVRVVGFLGEVNSTTSDGMISLEGEFSSVTADAGDGTVILTLPENTGVYLETASNNIFAEGLSLVKEDNKWKVGKGGDTYSINSGSDGKVIVRNSNRLRAAF